MHWRKSTWAFVIWTGLMILGLLAVPSAAANICSKWPSDCGGYEAIWALAVLFFWLLGAAPLSIILYATKPK
jgi:hypothetical protein